MNPWKWQQWKKDEEKEKGDIFVNSMYFLKKKVFASFEVKTKMKWQGHEHLMDKSLTLAK
jgi:hypothetical protein